MTRVLFSCISCAWYVVLAMEIQKNGETTSGVSYKVDGQTIHWKSEETKNLK